jgi:hypothetical protein
MTRVVEGMVIALRFKKLGYIRFLYIGFSIQLHRIADSYRLIYHFYLRMHWTILTLSLPGCNLLLNDGEGRVVFNRNWKQNSENWFGVISRPWNDIRIFLGHQVDDLVLYSNGLGNLERSPQYSRVGSRCYNVHGAKGLRTSDGGTIWTPTGCDVVDEQNSLVSEVGQVSRSCQCLRPVEYEQND